MVAFIASFASCSKVCSCTDRTGYTESVPIKVLGIKAYKNCKDLQNSLNSGDETVDWKCK